MSPFEIIGFSGSAFVLLSFTFKKIMLIRIINIIGAILFVVYGALIGAWSVWIMNALIIVVHSVYIILFQLQPKKLPSE